MTSVRQVSNPPNPWLERTLEYLDEIPPTHFEVFEDNARSILSRNDPAKVGFEFGLNPYRGCQHACAYCEARRRHELLGFGAGTDFDTKIVMKPNAPELLREAFESKSWKGDVVVFSGATDCYQPIEAAYQLTRRCLEVCAEYRNPVAIITKGALIERDLDVLTQLRDSARVTVSVSISLWNTDVARALEPLVPTPARRMRIIRRLAGAGLDVGISVAPFIVGASEERLGELLNEAKEAGATRATLSFLRLPTPVDVVFAERVHQVLSPSRAKVILTRAKAPDGYTKLAAALYETTCRRLGLPYSRPGDDRANTPDAGPLASRTFERPARAARQLGLFTR